jgi:hypothetical protein
MNCNMVPARLKADTGSISLLCLAPKSEREKVALEYSGQKTLRVMSHSLNFRHNEVHNPALSGFLCTEAVDIDD